MNLFTNYTIYGLNNCFCCILATAHIGILSKAINTFNSFYFDERKLMRDYVARNSMREICSLPLFFFLYTYMHTHAQISQNLKRGVNIYAANYLNELFRSEFNQMD